MRIRDIIVEGVDNSTLAATLSVIRNRMDDTDANTGVSVDSVIQMVKNTGGQLDYESLVDAARNDPAVKGLISKIKGNQVYFTPKKTADNVDNPDDTVVGEPTDAVGRMAKRAAKRRD
jgi:hypothetical protein